MYAVDELSRDATAASLERAREKAERSSLSATAWGLAYPDLWRLFSIGPFWDLRVDRGWAMEQVWRRTLGDERGELHLDDWRRPILEGEMPAVIFNGTVTETGERLLLSPLRIDPRPGDCPRFARHCRETVRGRTSSSLYADQRLPVTTAARLSATFPFVSPIARAERTTDSDPGYHVADGGYYDYYGVTTLVEWLREVCEILEESRLRPRILILEIRVSEPGGPAQPGRRNGWVTATAGPLVTLINVRKTSQVARNDQEIELVAELGKQRGFEVGTAVFPLLPPCEPDEDREQLRLPLSWHLTRAEKEAIRDGCREEGERKVREFLDAGQGWGSRIATGGQPDPGPVAREAENDAG